MTHRQKVRIAEFIIFGVIMNMLDNIISVLILGEAKFHWQMLVVIFLIVLPFGYVNEIIVDHPNFWKRIWPEVHPVRELESLIGYTPDNSKSSVSKKTSNKDFSNGVKEEARELEEDVKRIV